MKYPSKAMILTAGLGTRMHPITLLIPKPLVHVSGQPLIKYNLDALLKFEIERIVINIHYLPERMIRYVYEIGLPSIFVSYEDAILLDSGGGIRRALPLLGSDPFFVLNGDSFWIDQNESNLERLAEYWDPIKMDILLLLADQKQSVGYDGKGDFDLDISGNIRRTTSSSPKSLIYTGVAILKPQLFHDINESVFSLNVLFDQAIANNRLYGLKLDGDWFHVGTVDAIEVAERCLLNPGLKH